MKSFSLDSLCHVQMCFTPHIITLLEQVEMIRVHGAFIYFLHEIKRAHHRYEQDKTENEIKVKHCLLLFPSCVTQKVFNMDRRSGIEPIILLAVKFMNV